MRAYYFNQLVKMQINICKLLVTVVFVFKVPDRSSARILSGKGLLITGNKIITNFNNSNRCHETNCAGHTIGEVLTVPEIRSLKSSLLIASGNATGRESFLGLPKFIRLSYLKENCTQMSGLIRSLN